MIAWTIHQIPGAHCTHWVGSEESVLLKPRGKNADNWSASKTNGKSVLGKGIRKGNTRSIKHGRRILKERSLQFRVCGALCSIQTANRLKPKGEAVGQTQVQVYAQLSEAWTGAESEVSALNLLAFCAFLTNLAVHWERHGIHERNGNSILCGPKQTQIRFTGGRKNPCRIWLQIKLITSLLCFAVTWPESQKQPNKFRSLLPRWRFNLKMKSWNVRVFDCFCTQKSWTQMVNNWHRGCQPWWKTCALQTQKDADPLPKAITSHRTANVFLLWSFTLTTRPGYTSAPAPARKSELGRRASPPDAAWLER